MIFKATSVVFFTQISVAALLFSRNILVANLLSVEDYGIASTFAMLMTLVEMTTSIGVDKVIVQDRDGDTPEFQATLHSLQVIRRGIGALMMVALSYPYAAFVNTPELVWAYQVLAVGLFAMGFQHLDMARFQRSMRFRANAITMVGSPLLSVIVALVTYRLTPDYRIMLWAVVAQQAGLAVISHLVAERPYRLGWTQEYFLRSMRFGIPLMLNALALFLILNGDRLIVANQRGMEVLGWFTAAYTLAFMPTSILATTMSSLFLPRLSALRDRPEQFRVTAFTAIETSLLVAMLTAVGSALVAPALLILLFGAKFEAALSIVVLLAAMFAMRIAKSGTISTAMARGMTWMPLVANLLRLSLLPLSYLLLVGGAEVRMVVLVAFGGEFVGLLVMLALLRLRLDLPTERLALPLALFTLTLALVLLEGWLAPPGLDLFGNFHWHQGAMLISGLVFALSLENLRRLLRGLLKGRRPQV